MTITDDELDVTVQGLPGIGPATGPGHETLGPHLMPITGDLFTLVYLRTPHQY